MIEPDRLATAVAVVAVLVSIIALLYSRKAFEVSKATLAVKVPEISRSLYHGVLSLALTGEESGKWEIEKVSLRSPTDADFHQVDYSDDFYGGGITHLGKLLGRVVVDPPKQLFIVAAGEGDWRLDVTVALSASPRPSRHVVSLNLR